MWAGRPRPYNRIMSLLPEPFPGESACGYETRAAIDWDKYRAVVFESDDWGACEYARNAPDAAAVQELFDEKSAYGGSTLETPDDLEWLYQTLEAARGCDGQKAVFTAFMPMGNPDFAAIAASDFRDYHDIGLDEGFPPGWERGDLIGKWREGVARGVFAPEFHAGLHHTSPLLWLELLRGDGPDSQTARALFERHCYAQRVHLPEYHGLNAKTQHAWVGRAIARFERLFGFAPRAGVTSDALPMTEIIWSVNGLEIFCLKNCRTNDGETVVYGTKPWNSQDAACPMGAYNRRLDLVYLNRNLHLDNLTPRDGDEVAAVVESCWRRNEPVIVNTHRAGYVNFDAARAVAGRELLAELLAWLSAQERVRFLTTAEVGGLYRDGYSVREIGARRVLRQWSQPKREVRLAGAVERVVPLPDGREQKFYRDGSDTVLDLPEGDYLAE